MSYYIPTLIFLGILLFFSAFFSGSEAAIFSLSNLQKKRLKNQHPGAWKTISSLLDHPRRTLITILIGNMAVNTLAITMVTGVTLRTFGPQAVGWMMLLFTFVLVLTADLTPKVFAVRYNEWFALISAVPLDIIAKILYPVRRLVRWITDRVMSLLIGHVNDEADLVSGDELKALARIGEEEGALRPGEGEMIQNLISLGERIVREIMTPRTDMVAFDIDEGEEKLIELIQKFHFSYFPVYKNSLDHLLGFISTQEFMLNQKKDFKSFIKTPYYIPDTKPIDEVLQEFQKKGERVAICVDEYGGTAGLVTLEDILEEIFGEFYDEYTKAEPLIRSVEDGRFIVLSKINLTELNETLSTSLSSNVSETLNGWLLEQFGRIPKIQESIIWEGMEFIVKEVSKQRILKVEIKK